MIIVAGTIVFADPAARGAAVLASAELQRATRDGEPGCLAYCFAADPVEPLQVQVYELWADEAALAAHFEHPNYAEMRALLRQFPRGAASATSKFRCDASAPVYDTSGRPTASFDEA